MSRRTGAYARQLGEELLEELPAPDYTVEGPGWRAYAQTTTGLQVVPCGGHEQHARRINRLRRVIAEQGTPTGDAVPVGGVVLDPDGGRHDEWGCPVDPARSRWRTISRGTRWMRCQGCEIALWPGCMVTIKMAAHLVAENEANDEVCVGCQQSREVDDPRPAWPASAPSPPLQAWPDWLRPDKRKRVPLPKGYRFLGQPRRRAT